MALALALALMVLALLTSLQAGHVNMWLYRND